MSQKALIIYQELLENALNNCDCEAIYSGELIRSSDERLQIVEELISAGKIKNVEMLGQTKFRCTVII